MAEPSDKEEVKDEEEKDKEKKEKEEEEKKRGKNEEKKEKKRDLEEEEEEVIEISLIKAVLEDYCENTSVYTLRQIIQPSPYKIRKLYWFALLVAGFVFFSIQTYDSSMRYLSREVAVNMKINYNDSIRFPAVTICNQNAFRATKVAELGLYREVTRLFTRRQLHSQTLTATTPAEHLLYNMTMADLYTLTAHSRHDFILKCLWDEHECSPDDITTTMTDMGICFTFNKAKPGAPGKHIQKAGSQHALQIHLNIEQYEYMAGPSDGAGVRILLHDQQEAPPVKEVSASIPPGAHALVGGEIVLVENLQEPYGKCREDIDLQYYNKYSMDSCFVDCVERLLVAECGCRDFYMLPDKTNPEHLQDYLHCTCPISCNYTSVGKMISYGSVSNFDMEKMLAGNTSTLRRNYLKAKETNQRVNDIIAKSDHAQITALDSAIKRLDSIFNITQSKLRKCVDDLHGVLEVVEDRADFHANRALFSVSYTAEYNFKRYWMLQSERALDHLTTEFFPFGGSVVRVIESLCDTPNVAHGNAEMRELKWHPIENQILSKLDLANRVVGILRDVNESYATAVPLGTYKVTDNKRYDNSFLAIELFQPKHSLQYDYFQTALWHTKNMTIDLETLFSIGRDCVENRTYDKARLNKTITSYEYRCKMYNYFIFLLNNRIISNSLDLVNEKIDQFALLRKDLDSNHDKLEDIVAWLKDILSEGNSGYWNNIRKMSEKALGYLSNTTKKKSELADLAGSDIITESILNATRLFNDLLSRGKDFADGLQMVKKSFLTLYSTMLGESTTKAFYKRIHDEVHELLANNSLASHYIPIFEYLLKHTIEGQNYTDLVTKMNADFVNLNLSLLEDNTSKVFNQFSTSSDVADIMGNAADEFKTAITELRQSLSEYSKGNTIGTAFFRENFLSVNVFLRDLSYTEITQHIAYDENNLLGDIGGSAGLFVGASLITLFEIFDLLCHGICALKDRVYQKMARRNKRSPEKKPQQVAVEPVKQCINGGPKTTYKVPEDSRFFFLSPPVEVSKV